MLMALNYICNIPLAIFNIVICVDSKSVLYALQNWDCKMRRDIVYEVNYMIHYIIYKGIGVKFCWVPSHCGFYWNEISDKLAKQGATKNMSAISCTNHEMYSILEKAMYKGVDRNKPAIFSCTRYLAKVIYFDSLKFLEHNIFPECDMNL